MDKTTNSSTPFPDTRPSPENFQPSAPSIKASAKPQSESADPKLSNKPKRDTANSKPSAKPANAKPSVRPKPGAAIHELSTKPEAGTAKVKPKPGVTSLKASAAKPEPSAKFQPGAANLEPSVSNVKPDATSAKPGAVIPQPGAKPEPGTAKVKPGVTSPKTDTTKPKPSAKVQPGAANLEPTIASNVKHDATNAKPGAAIPQPSAKPGPGTAKVKPGVTSPKTGAAKPKPSAKVQPGAADLEPSASNVKHDATNAKTSAVKTPGVPVSSATTKSASVQLDAIHQKVILSIEAAGKAMSTARPKIEKAKTSKEARNNVVSKGSEVVGALLAPGRQVVDFLGALGPLFPLCKQVSNTLAALIKLESDRRERDVRVSVVYFDLARALAHVGALNQKSRPTKSIADALGESLKNFKGLMEEFGQFCEAYYETKAPESRLKHLLHWKSNKDGLNRFAERIERAKRDLIGLLSQQAMPHPGQHVDTLAQIESRLLQNRAFYCSLRDANEEIAEAFLSNHGGEAAVRMDGNLLKQLAITVGESVTQSIANAIKGAAETTLKQSRLAFASKLQGTLGKWVSGPQQKVQTGHQQKVQTGHQQKVQTAPKQKVQTDHQQKVQTGHQHKVQTGPNHNAKAIKKTQNRGRGEIEPDDESEWHVEGDHSRLRDDREPNEESTYYSPDVGVYEYVVGESARDDDDDQEPYRPLEDEDVGDELGGDSREPHLQEDEDAGVELGGDGDGDQEPHLQDDDDAGRGLGADDEDDSDQEARLQEDEDAGGGLGADDDEDDQTYLPNDEDADYEPGEEEGAGVELSGDDDSDQEPYPQEDEDANPERGDDDDDDQTPYLENVEDAGGNPGDVVQEPYHYYAQDDGYGDSASGGQSEDDGNHELGFYPQDDDEGGDGGADNYPQNDDEGDDVGDDW